MEKVISGGQTGVDRAALVAAFAIALPRGRWCPRGRQAVDGRIPERYPLRETPSGDYRQRTEWNVRDADATLVLTKGPPAGGTAYTVRSAGALRRPCLVIDLDGSPEPQTVGRWLRRHGIRVLNVAGPREAGAPGVYAQARAFL
ncbi:MAG: putative molybdenum carrier protein, partial [Gammaproteobacteria bacterium]